MKKREIIITVLTLYFLSCSVFPTSLNLDPKRQIALIKDGILFLADPEGNDLKQLTFISNSSYQSWSPDGTKIAFTSQDPSGINNIFVIDIDGSNMNQVTFEDFLGIKAVWSPDGTKITYRIRDGIIIVNSDGSDRTRITSGTSSYKLDFSPDGSKIVYVSSYFIDNKQPVFSDIYIVNSDGTNNTLIASGFQNNDPKFSPDGTIIVYSSGGGPEGSGIYTMNVDGTNKTRLTFDQSILQVKGNPFSPDGSKIVFISARSGNFDIYSMNSDGTDQTRLTQTGIISESHDGISNHNPQWSPDGEYIYYIEHVKESTWTINVTLKRMRTDGSLPVTIASDANFISVSFSPIW